MGSFINTYKKVASAVAVVVTVSMGFAVATATHPAHAAEVDSALKTVRVNIDGKFLTDFDYTKTTYTIPGKPAYVDLTGVPKGWTVDNALKKSSSSDRNKNDIHLGSDFTPEDTAKFKAAVGENFKPSYYTDSTDVKNPVVFNDFSLDKHEYVGMKVSQQQLVNLSFNLNDKDQAAYQAARAAGFGFGRASYDAQGRQTIERSEVKYLKLDIIANYSKDVRSMSYIFTAEPDLGPIAGGQSQGTAWHADDEWSILSNTFTDSSVSVTIRPVAAAPKAAVKSLVGTTAGATAAPVTYVFNYSAAAAAAAQAAPVPAVPGKPAPAAPAPAAPAQPEAAKPAPKSETKAKDPAQKSVLARTGSSISVVLVAALALALVSAGGLLLSRRTR
ncbi:hypothetical protein KIMH_02920 [Bombiscardovia apis]|uniref:Gram-positive cocci surface proteins LPxTG domain-containing protein n=1 Tax=Bombiscardovia apis TaxID=2932182 RepID=A0ABN6SG02_9BIFI|nr:hypothetical protein [Bombiscardovia apis]BDR54181.1 hypothetical protein KIMH_02920 [Bombiscardovia apis]